MTGSKGITFSEQQFNRLFPFYLILDETLLIKAAGHSLLKLQPACVGLPFADNFNLSRPFTTETDREGIAKLVNQLVVIECNNDARIPLRGQLELLPETNGYLFVGSPWFGSIEQVHENNFSLTDFAHHDPLIDLLHVLKNQEITTADLKELLSTLSDQKKELKKTADQLSDIALFTMQNPQPLLRLSPDGTVLLRNPAAMELTDLTCCDTQYADDAIWQQLAIAMKDAQEVYSFTATCNNQIYTFECRFIPGKNYINVYGRNITTERNKESQLRVLSQIAEDNINAVIIADQQGRIEWANKSFTQMTGYTLDEVKGKKPGHLLQGAETDRSTIDYLRRQLENCQPFNAEILNYRKNGSKYWLRITGQPIKSTTGVVTGFFALEEDITHEKELEGRLRQVLEKLGDNVWEHDFRTGRTIFSKSNDNLLGIDFTETSLNADLWWNSVLPEDLPKLAENDRRYKNREAYWHQLEYRLRHKDGGIRWVLDRGVVIERDKKGNPVRITGTHTDITGIKTTEAELANRVKQLQILSENVPGAIYEYEFKTDGTEGIRYISPAIEKLFGIKPEIFVKDLSFIHQDDLQGIIDKNRISRETLAQFYHETRLITPDGTLKWMSVQSSFAYETTEGSKIFTGVMLDITDRKNSEAQLEEQRKFYEHILNNIPADIAVFDKEHHYLFVNPKAIKDDTIRKWIIGKRDEDYCAYRNKPMSLAENRRTEFNKVLHNNQSLEWEEKIVKPDGSEEYVLRRLYPVLTNTSEKVELVIGYGLDITARKKVEIALAQNEEKYRNIIANMNLGLMETDLDARISYANQSMIHITGISSEEIIGYNSHSLLTPSNVELLKTKTAARKSGISEAYEIQVNLPKGKRWWLVSSAPKFDDKNVFCGSIVICIDISDQKRLQEQLIESREQAERLAKTKEIFLANMSHEIRTPMNAILGMSNQLSRTTLSGKQRFYLDTIHSAADNLLVIINDILDFSKIEAGKLSLEVIGFEPYEILKKAMQVVALKAEEKGLILINSRFNSKVARVAKGDPYRLSQVLLNLMTNSIKFTDSGTVDIEVDLVEDKSSQQLLRFTVSDTGMGMDEGFVEHLFDKFSQEYKSVTRKFGGTGLGMSISKQLVEMMGGQIQVSSKKGFGTSVSFTINVEKGTLSDLQKEEVQKITSEFLKGRTILVADDNDLNRVVALTLLQNYKANVIEAENGQEAVGMVQQHRPDLVLMDIQMPIMNGFDATAKIREFAPDLPIIALTANAIKGELEKCLEAGMTDYITKPFKEEDFLNKISKWLNITATENVSDVNTISAKEEKTALYSLAQLEEISRGNNAFVKRIIKLFCDQTPLHIAEMEAACRRQDFDMVGSIAHKIKPSIDSLAISVVKNTIREIEKNGKEKINTQELPSLVGFLKQHIELVVNDLKEVLND